jgi:pSer/pThr/pTyr-binding forkhead associated (FHA) protein
MPLLVVERGGEKGATLKLEGDKPFVVGRDNPQASFSMKDALASRSHFEIRKEGGAWVLRDMKSRNGTLVNDEKVTGAAPLAVGDKIQAGETIFSFLGDQKEEAGGGLTNKVIGGYRILERLGRGGMGTVYKAEQISLGRVVALKVLSSKLLSDPVFVERFVAEARAAGALNHPNIVQVFDVGSDRGVQFFSMELMEHGSVGDMGGKDGPIPWKRALEMMTDAARGLEFAEKRGVVHRDIKPDNLMLTAEGTVKIGDLGLAKKAEDAGEGGAIFGTPHFIAPEQAQGKPVDHRADLYALGASFYRILSGKTPFTGDNVKEILLKQVNDEPPPLGKLVADLPPELVAIIGKLMQKRPDDRYRSATGLVADLESVRIRYHLESHGALAGAKRTKALAAVLGLAVIGLGGVAYYYINKPPDVIDNTKYPIVTDTPKIVVPEKDPEKEADDAWTKARLAFLEQERKLGEPLKSWGRAAEWDPALAILDRVAKEHAEQPGGVEARRLAERIRADLATGRSTHEAAVAAAKSAFEAAMAKARAHHEAGEAVPALEVLAFDIPPILEKHRAFLPGDAEKQVHDLHRAVLAAVAAKADALAGAAAAAGATFPPKGLREALAAIEAHLPSLAPGKLEGDDRTAVAAAAEKLRAAAAAAAEAARNATLAALAADADDYFRAYLEIRRWAPDDGEFASPFFDFRFRDALARWEALEKTMRTPLFRARVAGKCDVYRRCQRFLEVVVERVNAKEIKDPTFPDAVKKGAVSVVLDVGVSRQATTDAIPILRVAGGREQRMLPWSEFTPAEFWVDFLKRGADGRLPPDSLWDAAAYLAEAGAVQPEVVSGEDRRGILLFEAMALAATAGKAAPPALLAWIRAEGSALSYHQMQVAAPFDAYLKDLAAKRDRDSLERQRKAILDRMADLDRNEEFTTTDYALLHRSMRGVEEARPRGMVSAEDVRRLLESLGIPAAPASAAPPPVNGGGGTEEHENGSTPKEPTPPGKDAPPRDAGGNGNGSKDTPPAEEQPPAKDGTKEQEKPQ